MKETTNFLEVKKSKVLLLLLFIRINMLSDEEIEKNKQEYFERVKRLKQRPPPTKERMLAQWKASYEHGWKNPYQDVKYIR